MAATDLILLPYTKSPLSADGGSNGILTIASTANYRVGAVVYLNGNSLPTVSLIVDSILSSTQLTVKANDNTSGYSYTRFDCSAYTVAQSASLTLPDQTSFTSTDYTTPSTFGSISASTISLPANGRLYLNGNGNDANIYWDTAIIQISKIISVTSNVQLGGGQLNCQGSPMTVQTVYQTDSSSAVGVVLGTREAWSTSGAKLASFQNGGTEKRAIDLNGKEMVSTGGASAFAGKSAAMTAGVVTITTNSVTANSLIQLTHAGTGVVANFGTLYVGTITAGTSFQIKSTNTSDTDAVYWEIKN